MIHINGADELARKYKSRGDNVKYSMKDAMWKAVDYVWGEIPEYPPPPTGSTYRRTGTLGRSITSDVRTLGGGHVVGLIGTKLEYAPWVISSEKIGDRGPQARVHKGRWYTLQSVVEKAHDAVIRIIKNAVIGKLD